jgi:hypothetical protein
VFQEAKSWQVESCVSGAGRYRAVFQEAKSWQVGLGSCVSGAGR